MTNSNTEIHPRTQSPSSEKERSPTTTTAEMDIALASLQRKTNRLFLFCFISCTVISLLVTFYPTEVLRYLAQTVAAPTVKISLRLIMALGSGFVVSAMLGGLVMNWQDKKKKAILEDYSEKRGSQGQEVIED